MERCDFSSVITIINDHISESKRGNQSDLIYALFDTFATDEINIEETFDEGAVCRWVNGVRKISPKITKYYSDNNKKICLSSDIEQNILPMMVDSDMAVRDIYDLVVYDTTISDGVKQKLTAGYPFSNSKEKADFLCAVLCFSMERSFIKREAGSKKLKEGKALSPIVNDVIFGADVPKPCRWFCGRDKELDELHNQLRENSKIFLQGIPGIGKSELAKAYAKKHKKDYTNIIYINYSGSLKADIVNLDFADDYNASEPEAERFRRHNRFLRSLKADSLIIIDNFNAIATDEELLSDVLEYSCCILFTTRSRFDDYDTYTVEEMSGDALLELMGKLFTDADKYQSILTDIIQSVHGHTFAVELAARLLEVGILAPDQLMEKLRAEKAAMDSKDKVSAKKDGKSKKATYYTHIHTLFSLYKLSSAETYIMCNLALAPRNGIAAKLIALWLKLENMNFINEMIERGFVQLLPGQIIVLHPMIQEIALDETKPSVTKCNTLLKSIQHICLRHGEDVLYYRQLFDTIETIIDLIENDDMDFYLRFLEDVFPYMEKYEFSNLRHIVTEKLSLLLSNDAVGTISDRALLLDYRATLEKDISKAIGYETQAIAMINEVTAENVHLICNLYTNLANLYHQNDDISLALNSLEKAIRFAKRFKPIFERTVVMAIYHLEAKAVSRESGRSAVAAAAYMSCSEIHNEYDGVTHDFTRKRGLVWQQVFLPKNAPPEWKDRSILWNAVEAAEKSKDSRLARELVVALPIELDKTRWIKLLTEYIQENFVADGMCADVAIHDTDGHNPHAHILLTVRPLDNKGKWQNKTEKEYLCVKNGEEKGFTSSEFASTKLEGWEKQYQYFVGKKKVYMPPSEAEKHCYERVNKYPKSTHFGRQNPIAARWNSDEQLVIWREQWAQITNKFLDEANRTDTHIDHRSHAARGLDEQPTIHEGYVARTIEQKGFVADRCEINRQIKADNALLRELKAAMRKISQTVKNTIPVLAEAMETLREKMIVIRYHLQAGSAVGRKGKRTIQAEKANLAKYTAVAEQITAKKKERKELQNKKKSTSVLRITIQRDLSRQIAELTEEIEELKSEKLRLLKKLRCADDKDIPKVKSEIARIESVLATLDETEKENASKLQKALRQYKIYREKAKAFNPAAFWSARLKLRPAKEKSAQAKLKAAYGKNFNEATYYAGIRDTDTANADHLAAQPIKKASETQNTRKPHIN